jgi:hypothetical protein
MSPTILRMLLTEKRDARRRQSRTPTTPHFRRGRLIDRAD